MKNTTCCVGKQQRNQMTSKRIRPCWKVRRTCDEPYIYLLPRFPATPQLVFNGVHWIVSADRVKKLTTRQPNNSRCLFPTLYTSQIKRSISGSQHQSRGSLKSILSPFSTHKATLRIVWLCYVTLPVFCWLKYFQFSGHRALIWKCFGILE